MNQASLLRFFEKLAGSVELRAEFVALAARHGIDLTDGELSDQELGAVSGGTVAAPSGIGAAENAATMQSMQSMQSKYEAAAKASAEADAIRKSIQSQWP